ncbi:transcriptional repressor, partial [Enterococcus faecium]|nr:transcriptional repressor [Enterococcus faecium]
MNKTSKEIAVKILKANNYKLTKQRQSLLNILANHEDRYMELTELDQLMRQEYPKMSYNTIYRNIKEFSEIGIVEENQNENDGKTEVKLDCNERHTHHHHF